MEVEDYVEDGTLTNDRMSCRRDKKENLKLL